MTDESNRIDVAYNRLNIRDIKPKKEDNIIGIIQCGGGLI